MTIILLKLFLIFFVTMMFCGFTRIHMAGKFCEYLFIFVIAGTMFFFLATICSFIWFF